MNRTISLISVTLVALPFAVFAAAPPPPRGEITDSVKGAEGLEEALRNLRAVMVTTPPLSPAEALKQNTARGMSGHRTNLVAIGPGSGRSAS